MEAASTAPGWSFLTNQGLALLVIAHDPHVRMRDLADAIGVTERTAQRIVNDLTDAGYVVRERHRRRNVYTVRSDKELGLPLDREVEIGELLAVLAPPGTAAAASHAKARDLRSEEESRQAPERRLSNRRRSSLLLPRRKTDR